MRDGEMTPRPVQAPRASWQVYAVFFAVTTLAASVGGLIGPGTWYATLQKPAWTPPNGLFAPVWTLLYIMIAIAGARAWRAGAGVFTIGLWGLQLALNAAWTWLFFGLHRPDLALIDIVALLIVIALFALSVRRNSPASSVLVVPYLAWVSYATALNLAIWRMNG